MTEELKLPINFDTCPNCGSIETVAQLAVAPLKASGKIDKNAPTRARMDAVPLIQPSLVVASVPTLVRHFDTCAVCGLERCVKAEVIDAPIQFQQMPPRTMGPQQPFDGLPFGKG